MNISKPKDVDEYIANSDKQAHSILREIRETIKTTIPNVEEKISYSVPFYKYHGEFVGFATYKKHVSFGFGADVLQNSDREVLIQKGYVLGKATMQIKFDQKVPATEIKKILIEKARMNEMK